MIPQPLRRNDNTLGATCPLYPAIPGARRPSIPYRVESDLAYLPPASSQSPADDLTNLLILPCSPASMWSSICQDSPRQRLVVDRGTAMPPCPLHQQRLLNREILINERLGLHLVWGAAAYSSSRCRASSPSRASGLRCSQPSSPLVAQQSFA